MILKGSRRGGGVQLARHLENGEDNEHVTVHEIRGFVSDSIAGAFSEAHGISKGTRCQKFLYSLSLSPPERESVPVEVFENAIEEIEQKLGYIGHGRVVIFHEKEGRRHAHCVWSRINVEQMKAVDPSYEKLKLRDISRQLYFENNWQMPRGLMNSEERDPLNFTMAELQQARRAKQDVRFLKETFQDCWAVSDTRTAFSQALEERGLYLAKGRRGHVAVDWRGEVYGISKWVGIRVKELRAKLGPVDDLPTVEETKREICDRFSERLKRHAEETELQHIKRDRSLDQVRRGLTAKHRYKRDELVRTLRDRRVVETRKRAARLPTGIKGLWFRVTGKYNKIKVQNQSEAADCDRRDHTELQQLVQKQLSVRQRLQHEIRTHRHHYALSVKLLNREMGEFLKLSPTDQEFELSKLETQRNRQGRRLARSIEFGR